MSYSSHRLNTVLDSISGSESQLFCSTTHSGPFLGIAFQFKRSFLTFVTKSPLGSIDGSRIRWSVNGKLHFWKLERKNIGLGKKCTVYVFQIVVQNLGKFKTNTCTYFLCGWDLAEWFEHLTAIPICRSSKCPGFDPSILRRSGIWGAEMKQLWIK